MIEREEKRECGDAIRDKLTEQLASSLIVSFPPFLSRRSEIE
jgi:hypothetical protein